jgi:3-oxoadipate enol-lactonase
LGDYRLSEFAGGTLKVEVAGGTVSATVMGRGQTIILFHSLLADRGSFAAIIPPLSKNFRVIAVDLPGFGDSSFLDGDLIAIADHMAEAVSQLSDGTPPIILGNGFGGFVALQMTIRHPTIVSRLIIADSGVRFSETGRQAFRNMAAAASAKGLEAVVETAMRRLFSLEFQEKNPELMLERREAFLRTNTKTFQNACADLAELDLGYATHTLFTPTLVLVGDQDEATPPAMSEELASLLPDSRFIKLQGCAHVPQLQMPNLFLEAVMAFITSPTN